MFVNERPKKRRKRKKPATKPKEDGCEWEEVRLDTPDILEMETEWEKNMMGANETGEAEVVMEDAGTQEAGKV
ncbi:hypothetical protein TWF718_008738 [Orbilia javanica]|uniref:Uncharacterized protein n=1 Tax=Orbilia javanica TaxID=47235 RepID=A0AAN8NRR8_9PEZI